MSDKGCCLSLKLSCLLWLGCVCSVSFASGFPAPVEVATVEKRVIAPSIWVAAAVVSRDQALIAAEAEGRLLFVVEEGDRLSVGDVIAEVDNTSLKISLLEAQAEVSREGAQLNFLDREVERLQRLARQNNAARTLLDETAARRDASVHGLSAAQARVQLAQDRIDRTRITAPFDGVVVERLKRKGEWLNQGEVVVRLVNDRHLEIETFVPLKLKPFIASGQRLSVMLDGKQAEAVVRVVTAVADGPSHLMRVRLDVTGDRWLVGQVVRVAVPTATAREVLTIPRDAMVLRGRGVSVFRVKDDRTAEKLAVTTGVAQGDYIEVSGALKVGDQVIVRGGERLRPGQALRLLTGGGVGDDKLANAAQPKGENPWWSGNQDGAEEEGGADSGEAVSGGNPWWPGKSDDTGDDAAWSGQRTAKLVADEE